MVVDSLTHLFDTYTYTYIASNIQYITIEEPIGNYNNNFTLIFIIFIVFKEFLF